MRVKATCCWFCALRILVFSSCGLRGLDAILAVARDGAELKLRDGLIVGDLGLIELGAVGVDLAARYRLLRQQRCIGVVDALRFVERALGRFNLSLILNAGILFVDARSRHVRYGVGIVGLGACGVKIQRRILDRGEKLSSRNVRSGLDVDVLDVTSDQGRYRDGGRIHHDAVLRQRNRKVAVRDAVRLDGDGVVGAPAPRHDRDADDGDERDDDDDGVPRAIHERPSLEIGYRALRCVRT